MTKKMTTTGRKAESTFGICKTLIRVSVGPRIVDGIAMCRECEEDARTAKINAAMEEAPPTVKEYAGKTVYNNQGESVGRFTDRGVFELEEGE